MSSGGHFALIATDPQPNKGCPDDSPHDKFPAMKRAIHLGVVVSILALTGFSALGASAEETDKVRRDDAGKTGVSPYWETLKKGDNAFIAGAYDEAKTYYESAIKLDPRNPLGHTRVAQTLLMKGELEAADDRLESALGFANTTAQRTKIIFLQADIRERQVKLEQAKQRWDGYIKMAGDKINADDAKKIHPATAKQRIEQIEATKKRNEGYAAVKERITKREKELDDKAHGK